MIRSNFTSHTDRESHTSKYKYGAYDLLQEMRDAKGNPIAFQYDDEGRLTGLKNAADEVYSLIRDKAGNVVEEVDFAGRRQFYGFDAVDRLIERVAPNGVLTRLDYDEVDQLTKATVHDGPEVDNLDLTYTTRLAEADIPKPLQLQPRETTYTYDIDGQLLSAKTEAAAVILDYDALGRVVTETQTDLVTGQTTALSSDYSLRGRTAFRPGDLGGGQQVSYDEQGRPTALQIGSARPLEFAYNRRGQEILRGVAGRHASTSAYSSVGELIDQKLFGGGQALIDAKATLGLDQPIKRYGSQTPSKTVGEDHLKNRRRYTYDRNSSPTEIADKLLGTASYQTDANGQVIQAQHRFGKGAKGAKEAQVEETFNYSSTQDLVGKSLAGQNLPADLGQRLSDSVGQIDRPESVLRDGTRVQRVGPYLSYTYDSAGRVLERREEKPGFRPHIQRYTWNGSDQMIGAKVKRNGKQEYWAYTYDALGRRIKKEAVTLSKSEAHIERSNQVRAVSYLWDGNALVAEQKLYADGTQAQILWHYTTDSDFTPVAREEISNKGPSAKGNNPSDEPPLSKEDYPDEANAHVPIGEAANDELERNIHYLNADHLGTIREAIDAEGEIAWAASYRLWGEELSLQHTFDNDEAANDFQPFRFPGQQFDTETGLNYNRFRTYDSNAGSYLCGDPSTLDGGLRIFGFVRSSLKSTDPFGLHEVLAVLDGQPIFDGNYQYWRNTTGSGKNAFNGFGRAGDSEARILESLNNSHKGRLKGATLELTSLGQMTKGGKYHMPPLAPCKHCQNGMKNFAQKNNMTIKYTYFDGDGKRITHTWDRNGKERISICG